jgi:hypothetical protein
LNEGAGRLAAMGKALERFWFSALFALQGFAGGDRRAVRRRRCGDLGAL